MKGILKFISTVPKLKNYFLFMLILVRSIVHFLVLMYSSFLISDVHARLQSNSAVTELSNVLFKSCLLLFLILLLQEVLGNVSEYMFQKIEFEIRMEMRQLGLATSYEQFESQKINIFMQKNDSSLIYTGGVRSFMNQVSQLLNRLVVIVLSAMIILSYFIRNRVFVHLQEWLVFGLAILVMISCVLGITRYIYDKNAAKQKETYSEIMTGEMELNYYLFHVINDYKKNKTLKVYHAIDFIIGKYKALIEGACRKNVDYLKLAYNNQFLANSLRLIVFFTFLLVLTYFSKSKTLTFLFIMAIYNFSDALTNIFIAYKDLELSVSKLQPLHAFFEKLGIIEHVQQSKDNFSDISKFNKPIIEFKNVSFTYPHSDQEVFHQLNVRLSFEDLRGIAIVGKNGSGKSTFLKLLMKMYQPTSGTICLNGVDIQNIDNQLYYRILSLLPQDYSLLDDTVAGNITCQTDWNQEEVTNFLDTLDFADFVNDLPNKCQSLVGREIHEGIQFSQGQQQKIALARTFYRNPNLVVLDEPTAALDPISELELFQQIERRYGQQSFLFVTHKMAACLLSDHIIVFDGGKVVASGQHKELVSNSSVYKQLYESQVLT
ncbi:TPA: ATP-binding cassette domain-containing protein [Streptococcus suis]